MMNELNKTFSKLLNALDIKDEITKEQILNLPFDEEELEYFYGFLKQNNIEIVDKEETSLDFFRQLDNEMSLYHHWESTELLASKDENGLIPDSLRIEISQYHYALILSIIKKYYPHGFSFFPCYSEWDAFQDGYIGLLKALDHFKSELGYSFSTYATYWIYAEINKNYSSFCHLLSYSDKMKVKLNWYYRKREEYLNKYDNINLEEFAADNGLLIDEVLFYEKHVVYGASLDEICESHDPDIPGKELKFFLPLDYNLEDDVVNKVLTKDVSSYLSILNDFEKDIILNRYGFKDGDFHSHKDLGMMIRKKGKSVSAECIRVNEKKALNKLRTRIMEGFGG